MAIEEPSAIVDDKGIRTGFNETGGALTRRLFVKRVAGGDVDGIALCGNGERALGVLMDTVADDDRGNVQITGQAIVTAAAAIVRGADVAADAAGKCVVAATGDIVLGVTRNAAAAADEDISIELAGTLGGNITP